MLISMPTGTSTIFGVFQAIPSSQEFYQEFRRGLHAGVESRTTLDTAQVRKIEPSACGPILTADISLPDKAISLLDKITRLVIAAAPGNAFPLGESLTPQWLS